MHKFQVHFLLLNFFDILELILSNKFYLYNAEEIIKQRYFIKLL